MLNYKWTNLIVKQLTLFTRKQEKLKYSSELIFSMISLNVIGTINLQGLDILDI